MMRELNNKLPGNVLDAFEFVYQNSSSGQSEWELKSLLIEVYNELRPKRILELGVYNGSNSYILNQISNQIVLGVDIVDVVDDIFKNGCLNLVVGNTHDEDTFNLVNSLLDNNLVDFLFIDADHTYESVKLDYEIWRKLVRPGGWIAFHDIDPNHVTPMECQVNKFWDELIGNKVEYIATQDHVDVGGSRGIYPGYGGIGLLKT